MTQALLKQFRAEGGFKSDPSSNFGNIFATKLDVEVNYQNPDNTVGVSAYRMYPAPVNVYAGSSSKIPGNTIWDNFGNLSAPGDSIGFTFTDQSFSKIYRVTVIAEVMPDGGGTAGQAYCIIEELK